MKPCIIKQPAGIGDIFFCQKLAKIMMAHKYSVIWPVREDILWIGDYIKDITFVSENWNFLDKTVFQNAFGAYVGDDMAFMLRLTAQLIFFLFHSNRLQKLPMTFLDRMKYHWYHNHSSF